MRVPVPLLEPVPLGEGVVLPVPVGVGEGDPLVESLPGFKEEPGHPCNERILEAIQQAWIDERD